MFEEIQNLGNQLCSTFELIPTERRELLNRIAISVSDELKVKNEANLIYVCTHNSRRSHFGQIWSAVAAAYFGIENINTFSAGTEATAFHPNAMNALRSQGFTINALSVSQNPIYEVDFGGTKSIKCFSKTITDESLPKALIAIMTCSDAAENCPFVPGASHRFNTTYDDPKAYDGTNLQQEKYIERSLQIAREIFYLFYEIKNQI